MDSEQPVVKVTQQLDCLSSLTPQQGYICIETCQSAGGRFDKVDQNTLDGLALQFEISECIRRWWCTVFPANQKVRKMGTMPSRRPGILFVHDPNGLNKTTAGGYCNCMLVKLSLLMTSILSRMMSVIMPREPLARLTSVDMFMNTITFMPMADFVGQVASLLKFQLGYPPTLLQCERLNVYKVMHNDNVSRLSGFVTVPFQCLCIPSSVNTVLGSY